MSETARRSIIDLSKLRALSSLLSRSNLGQALGYQYSGDRDLYKALGYSRNLTSAMLRQRYLRNDIATRIVNAPASATWRQAPVVKDHIEESFDPSEFQVAWSRLTRKLMLMHNLERLDRLSGLGAYAILYLGAPGAPETPLTQVSGPDEIAYVRPYGEFRVSIHAFETNVKNSRYGQPVMYKINFAGDTELLVETFPNRIRRSGMPETLVHHTRVIHVAQGALDDEVYGVPPLAVVFNRLDDLDKIVGGTSEAVWRVVDRGLQFDVDPEMELSPEDEGKLNDEVEDYIHNIRRYIRTKGVTTTVLGSSAPDPRGAFQAVISLIAGATGIPQRILIGSERGELASSQDRAAWSERIAERRENFAEPVIVRPLIDRFVQLGALPGPQDDQYDLLWPDLLALTDIDRADVAFRIASAVARIASQSGTEVMSAAEFRVQYLHLPPEPPDGKLQAIPDTPGRFKPRPRQISGVK